MLPYWAMTATWPEVAICFFSFFVFVTIGSSIGFHRITAHNLKVSKWFYYFATTISTLQGAGSILAYVSNHRQHHRYADTAKDPHSPHTQSLVKVILMRGYQTLDVRAIIRLSRNLKSTDWLAITYTYYWAIVLAFSTLLVLISPRLVMYGYIVPAVLSTFAISFFVDYLCHTRLGYVNFKVGDTSKNISWLVWITGGESLHNTHHKYAGRKNLAVHWYEVDVGYIVLKLFRQV